MRKKSIKNYLFYPFLVMIFSINATAAEINLSGVLSDKIMELPAELKQVFPESSIFWEGVFKWEIYVPFESISGQENKLIFSNRNSYSGIQEQINSQKKPDITIFYPIKTEKALEGNQIYSVFARVEYGFTPGIGSVFDLSHNKLRENRYLGNSKMQIACRNISDQSILFSEEFFQRIDENADFIQTQVVADPGLWDSAPRELFSVMNPKERQATAEVGLHRFTFSGSQCDKQLRIYFKASHFEMLTFSGLQYAILKESQI